MKNRISILFGVSILALTTASCGFPNIFTVKLKTLTISDSVSKTYVVGESYFDFANLTITGKYSNGETKHFEREDVAFTLTSGGTTYDISSPFSASGTYSLKASKDGVKSNALSITVLPEPKYVESIAVVGDTSVGINQEIELTLNVSPSDFTVDIQSGVTDSNIASLTRINDRTYKVRGNAIGSTNLLFKAHDTEDTYVSANHPITVTENYVTSISVSGASTVARQSSITLNLTVNPSYFSVDITATSSNNSIATVEKLNNTSFRVNGLIVGNADITFSAPSGPGTTVTATHSVEVLNMVKTDIAQTYNTYSKHTAYGTVCCPLEGNVKLLVIPTWFTDSNNYIATSKKETVRSDIQKAYFGTTTETGWHSVSSYYFEESSGALNLSGTVSEWWNCNLSSDDVKPEDYDTGALVKRAAKWYFENHTDTKTDYDSDHDKYFDGVMLIYGCPNYATLRESQNNLWAYCYWVNNPSGTTSDPGVNVYFWASYDFMYDSSNASSHTGNNYYYYGSDCSHCTIDAHTYIHEMGHVLGLEDYYDYAQATSPAGGFSMQDYNVGGHDAFSVMAFGWADPYIPTASCDITINDFQSSRDMILLTPSWNSKDSPFDEYLLLELFTPTGLNYNDCTYAYGGGSKGPTTPGIRLWHVDARLMDQYGNIHVDATKNAIYGLLNNTSSVDVRPCPGSYIDENYQSYNLLQLIRNNTSATTTSTSFLSNSDLFTAQSGKNTFSMSAFRNQFVDGTTLDKGVSLGWSFTVTAITNNGNGTYSATIRLTRA